MITRHYTPLLHLRATRAAGDGPYHDVDFVATGSTKRALQRGRCLCRRGAGDLTVLCERNTGGSPVAALDGVALRFGLRSLDPHFANLTQPAPDPRFPLPLYRNATEATTLDPALPATVVAHAPRHRISRTARPVEVRLADGDGIVLQTVLVGEGDARDVVSFAEPPPGAATERRPPLPPGLYTVRETYTGGLTKSGVYCLDRELVGQSLHALVDIRIATAHYETPADFSVDFAARAMSLRYYIVVRTSNPAVPASIALSDAGGDDAAPLLFERAPDSELSTDTIATGLASAGTSVLLFRSSEPVPRGRPRRKLRLTRNGEVLLEPLPAPAPTQANADVIVHVDAN